MKIIVHAPFSVRNKWIWETFSTPDPNIHAACFDKAKELGALCWDTSQASVEIDGTCVQGNPSVFA